MVKAVKHTERAMDAGVHLNYQERMLLLRQATCVVNNRPLGARFRNGCEPGFDVITPNLLLHGHDTEVQDELAEDFETLDEVSPCLKMLRIQHEAWWKQWHSQCFETLLPFPRWKKSHPNVAVGDVCMLNWTSKLGPGEYRLCRVIKVFPDANGLVGDAEVKLRPRRKTEPVLPYKSKKPTTMVVSIQRLKLVVPMDYIAEAPEVNPSLITAILTP